MGGAKMKKKGMSKGGLKMVKGPDGKMVPFYAADGKGKMNKGGMSKKKKGMANGGTAMMKKKKGMANGGAMKKKSYSKGGVTYIDMRKSGLFK